MFARGQFTHFGVAEIRTPLQGIDLFLSPPAARVDYLEAQHKRVICLSLDVHGSAAIAGRPRRESPGSLSWFVLSRMRKNEHLCCTDQRAPQVRSMIVRRKS